MNNINPFEKPYNFNLTQYINNGGDINIFHPETGESLFMFLRKKCICSSFSNGFGNPPIKLLTIKKYILEEDQNDIYSALSFFNDFDICDKKYDYETFINRFDLSHNISWLRKPLPGLHFFLSSYKKLDFFFYAEKLHRQFYDNLKTTCPDGNNLWHFIVQTLALIPYQSNQNPVYSIKAFNKKDVEDAFKILNFLFENFPEGLLEKNNKGLTPLESIICNTSCHHYYKYFELIDHKFTQKSKTVDTLKKMLLNIDLKDNLLINNKPNKILKI